MNDLNPQSPHHSLTPDAKRNVSLDILKLLMAFMVIGIHAGFLGEFSKLGEYLTVNGVFRIAVPVFFIINGFYFYPVLSKNNQLLWLKRIVILYLVWMTFYVYFWFNIPELTLYGFVELIGKFLIGYFHLWYVSGLIGAAIILIALRRVSSKYLVAIIAITFIIGVMIQYAGNYHFFSGTVLDKVFNFHWVHRNFLFLAFPFFCIGYLINKHTLYQKVSIERVMVLIVVGFSILFFESYINFYHADREESFDNFVSLIVVCPAIFILFIKQHISGHSKQVALYASAIYFIHVFVLSVLRHFADLHNTLLTIFGIVISIMISFLIIEGNKKFKFIL